MGVALLASHVPGGTTILLGPPDPYGLTGLVQTTYTYYFNGTYRVLTASRCPAFPSVLVRRTLLLLFGPLMPLAGLKCH